MPWVWWAVHLRNVTMANPGFSGLIVLAEQRPSHPGCSASTHHTSGVHRTVFTQWLRVQHAGTPGQPRHLPSVASSPVTPAHSQHDGGLSERQGPRVTIVFSGRRDFGMTSNHSKTQAGNCRQNAMDGKEIIVRSQLEYFCGHRRPTSRLAGTFLKDALWSCRYGGKMS